MDCVSVGRGENPLIGGYVSFLERVARVAIPAIAIIDFLIKLRLFISRWTFSNSWLIVPSLKKSFVSRLSSQ